MQRIRAWILISALINYLAAEAQNWMLRTGRMGMVSTYTLQDQVQGTFYLSGGRWLCFCRYLCYGCALLFSICKINTYLASSFGSSCRYSPHNYFLSTKQVLTTCLMGLVILGVSKFLDIKKFLIYGATISLVVYGFYWAAYNVEALSLFGYFLDRTELYQGPNAGPSLKVEGIRMVISYYESPLNWLLGLGPGHTLGRLGGWTIRDYWSLLGPLGATTHPLYEQVWRLVNNSWILLSSTFFVPLFSWAGIWGDMGFLGLGSYLYLGILTWRRLCLDDFFAGI